MTNKVKAYDTCVIKQQSAILELPAGIHFRLNSQIPNFSSVRKTYFMVLPLIVVNYFQTNHKLTLGQSSLETSTAEIFKSELLSYFERLPWDVLHQNGYSIDINVYEIAATGVFASGYAAAFGAGNTGAMGKIARCMKIHSKLHFSFTFHKNDSTLFQRDLTFLVKADESGKLKLLYIDTQTGETSSMPTKLPNVVSGDSFELLIPSTKEIYGICIKVASKEIVDKIENYLSDFYSDP